MSDDGKRTGAEILWETLAREGVEVVFGYPGGAIMPAYDAMLKSSVRHVLVRHEQGAAHMADGYARASGRVGVCVATSGPGATNLVTGHRDRDARFDPHGVRHRAGRVAVHRQRRLPGDGHHRRHAPDHQAQLPGDARRGHRAHAAAGVLRRALGPARARCSSTSPRTRSRRRRTSCGTAAPCACPGYRPEHRPERAGRAARRGPHRRAPSGRSSSAGTASSPSGASALLLDFVEKTGMPVASTLLGLGGFPATHPLCLGMMGMHGEAWVNQAIQESDLIIALGMRFDDRVTGKLATYAKRAKKIHCELDPAEINKNVRVDVPLVGDVAETLRALVPGRAPSATARRGSSASTSSRATRRCATSRRCRHARAPLRRARDARPLAHHRGQGARRDRRRPAPDVGGPVLQARLPAEAHHLGRPRDDGLRPPGGDRREVRAARRRGVGHRRRRRLPDDRGRALHLRAGGHQDPRGRHQQRLPGHGPPVAAVLLRRSLRGDAAARARTS